jgi:hypothetical protein
MDDVWCFLRSAAALEKRLIHQKRETALFMDDCPAHSVDAKLIAIKLTSLFATEYGQNPVALRQGTTQNLKFHYRKLLLRK